MKAKVLPFCKPTNGTSRPRACLSPLACALLEARRQPVEGVSLEAAVAELESRLIRAALRQAKGSTYEASALLGLRTEEALLFILRRHPEIRPGEKGGKS